MTTQAVYKIRHLQKVDSTNVYAIRNLGNLTDKEVIISDVQTNGKGRLERNWVSEREGNIYLSIVLKPCDKITNTLPLSNLTQYMSVVLCKVLENYGIITQIKWPNDVLVDNKKIAGILSQISVNRDNLKGFVLGLGVNLNMAGEDLEKIDQEATSLNLLIGKPVNKEVFTEELLDEFFRNYDLFLQKGFPLIKREYISKSSFLDKKIAVNSLDFIEKGTVKEIMDDGSLVIINEQMKEKIITMGDIICL